MDVLYDLEHGIWGQGAGGALEVAINALTLAGSAGCCAGPGAAARRCCRGDTAAGAARSEDAARPLARHASPGAGSVPPAPNDYHVKRG